MKNSQVVNNNEKELESLIQSMRIYSQEIGIEFGIEKCTMLVMKSGKRHMAEGMEQPDQEKSDYSEKRKQEGMKEKN